MNPLLTPQTPRPHENRDSIRARALPAVWMAGGDIPGLSPFAVRRFTLKTQDLPEL